MTEGGRVKAEGGMPPVIEVIHTFGNQPLTMTEVKFLAELAEKLEREAPERELLMRQLEEDDACDE